MYRHVAIFTLFLFSGICAVQLNLNNYSTANRTKIIRAFAPEVRLDSGEDYFPSSVQWFWKRCSLRYFRNEKLGKIILNGPQITSLRLGNYNEQNFPETNFALWPNQRRLTGEAPVGNQIISPCYAHIRPSGDGAIIQYLFFYPYNKPTLILGALGKTHEAYRTAADVGASGAEKVADVGKKGVSKTKKAAGKIGGLFGKKKKKKKKDKKPKKTEIKRVEKLEVGSHEGDWEHIDIHIKPKQKGSSDYRIEKVFYARHKTKDGRFDSFKTVDNTHPIVYSAQFGHASYGEPIYTQNKLADKANGRGARWQTWKNAIYIGTLEKPTIGSEWIKFKGKWGEITAPARAAWWLKQ